MKKVGLTLKQMVEAVNVNVDNPWEVVGIGRSTSTYYTVRPHSAVSVCANYCNVSLIYHTRHEENKGKRHQE